MPRHTRPRPRLVPDLEVAAVAFGSREDLAILALLGQVEAATAVEAADQLEMALNTLHDHLGQLESLGLVTADTPAGSRRGRTVRYALDRHAAGEVVDKMKVALLGERGG